MRRYDTSDENVNAAAAYKLRSIQRKMARQQEIRDQIISVILFAAIIAIGIAVAVFCSDSVGAYADSQEATVQVQEGNYSYDADGYEQYLEEKAAADAEESAHWAYLNNGGDHAD